MKELISDYFVCCGMVFVVIYAIVIMRETFRRRDDEEVQ